jgi:hypothetical protein
MKDEIDLLMTNQTWDLIELPVGEKALHNKWVYRIKGENDGSKCYKARLVVKGFNKRKVLITHIFPSCKDDNNKNRTENFTGRRSTF